jgi:ubiquinone/menaquinone biosynthesis C-methylase UbiE
LNNDLKKWIDKKGEEILRKIGIGCDQTVLDFGCGKGNYAIPSAKIVGRRGRVYALDKESRGSWPSEGLDELIRRVESLRLENIVVIKTSGELKIDLNDESMDVILAYDVLHSWYFPRPKNRRTVLREFHRILKPSGFLSFYPGDPEIRGNILELYTLKKDIKNANFQFKSEYIVEIIHEDTIQNGHIMNYMKT